MTESIQPAQPVFVGSAMPFQSTARAQLSGVSYYGSYDPSRAGEFMTHPQPTWSWVHKDARYYLLIHRAVNPACLVCNETTDLAYRNHAY